MKHLYKYITALLLCLLSVLTLQAQQPVKSGSTWYSAKPSNFTIKTIGSKEFTAYPPSTGSISYTYKYEKADLIGWFANFNTKIYCSTDNGSSYGSALDGGSGSSFKTYSKTVSGLNTLANKIKFERPTGDTHNMTYSNILLPLATHIRLNYNDNTYGTTDYTLPKFADTKW
ncbi:MAG: hypothetical protein IJV55_01590 [Paludibacteraceae bacterium]|nr:hypothetical protein [Paludibacteraceae bacterium]